MCGVDRADLEDVGGGMLPPSGTPVGPVTRFDVQLAS